MRSHERRKEEAVVRSGSLLSNFVLRLIDCV